MKHERDEDLSRNLHALLGDAGFLALVETFAGERIYVPMSGANDRLSEGLGHEDAAKLCRAYPGMRISVPLARDFRARQYRAAGLNNHEIAKRLNITVSGVDRIFRRMPSPPNRPRRIDPRQSDLFES